MASSPSEVVRFPCMCGGPKVQKGGGLELGEWAELWQSRDTNPRTKRCYAYNILHFRLFLPYYRPCRFVFFLGGLRTDGLRRRRVRHAGTKTYTVRGKTYRPYLSADGYRGRRVASWYGRDFHGKTTANGERYNMYAMTAAHKLLPLGTKVRVTHLRNGKSIVVRVNDRGPFVEGSDHRSFVCEREGTGHDRHGYGACPCRGDRKPLAARPPAI